MSKGSAALGAKLAARLLLLSVPIVAAIGAPAQEGTSPTISVTTDGTTSGYFVRFAGPVDHEASQVRIIQDGHVLETLRPRLDSAPNVLFARSRALPPGTYQLDWSVRSMTDHSLTEGNASFTVEQGH